MSGIQEIAAIIGLTEVAFRSISSLYDFIEDLRHATVELERIKAETSSLIETLLILSSRVDADTELQALSRQVGLAKAVYRCDQACDKLLRELSRWASGSTLARVQFRVHKRSVDSVISEIAATKQTTILTLGITQLYVSTLPRAYRMLTPC